MSPYDYRRRRPPHDPGGMQVGPATAGWYDFDAAGGRYDRGGPVPPAGGSRAMPRRYDHGLRGYDHLLRGFDHGVRRNDQVFRGRRGPEQDEDVRRARRAEATYDFGLRGGGRLIEDAERWHGAVHGRGRAPDHGHPRRHRARYDW